MYADALARPNYAGHGYRCRCSRSNLEPFGGIHRRTCIARETSPRPRRAFAVAIRAYFDDVIHVALIQHLRCEVGDFVIWRVAGGCAYELAVAVDDAARDIYVIVRGSDLLESTPR